MSVCKAGFDWIIIIIIIIIIVIIINNFIFFTIIIIRMFKNFLVANMSQRRSKWAIFSYWGKDGKCHICIQANTGL